MVEIREYYVRSVRYKKVSLYMSSDFPVNINIYTSFRLAHSAFAFNLTHISFRLNQLFQATFCTTRQSKLQSIHHQSGSESSDLSATRLTLEPSCCIRLFGSFRTTACPGEFFVYSEHASIPKLRISCNSCLNHSGSSSHPASSDMLRPNCGDLLRIW